VSNVECESVGLKEVIGIQETLARAREMVSCEFVSKHLLLLLYGILTAQRPQNAIAGGTMLASPPMNTRAATSLDPVHQRRQLPDLVKKRTETHIGQGSALTPSSGP
jgi:hypothetical protein